jgi:chorismate-pyruvate lyase
MVDNIEYLTPNTEPMKLMIDLYKFCVEQELIGHAEVVLRNIVMGCQPRIVITGDTKIHLSDMDMGGQFSGR